MFLSLGKLITQHPWAWVAAWILAGVAAAVGHAPPASPHSEPASMLPAGGPMDQALKLERRAFPHLAAQSQIVLVFRRSGGLTAADRARLAAITLGLQQAGVSAPDPWRVQSGLLPGQPHLQQRLESRDGEALMIVLNLDVNFVTERAAAAVEAAEQLVRAELPAGLTFEVTGTAAIGRDHGLRAQAALRRTTWVTVAAVCLILLAVYRSVLAAAVPLAAIGLSVFIALRVLDWLAALGWSISAAERTFTVVLLYGAGTDYALFWASRYREELAAGLMRAAAAQRAMAAVGPAVAASAATTILGLSVLIAADLVVIHNAGKVLGIVLAIALLAALTLTPALACLAGRAFFWPRRPAGSRGGVLWPWAAAWVSRRPGAVLPVVLAVTSVPALLAWRTPIRYDSFGQIPRDSSSGRGLQLVQAHFAGGELFSTKLLLESPALPAEPATLRAMSAQIAEQLRRVPEVTDIWHLQEPLGGRQSWLGGLLAQFAGGRALAHYAADAPRVLRFEVMLEPPAMTAPAAAAYQRLRAELETWAAGRLGDFRVHATGQTAYVDEVRRTGNADMLRVMAGVMAVICPIVVVITRRLGLSLFMVGGTLLSYAATVGLTGVLFVDVLGAAGIDYKVQIFVFVIIVAVGQDYNILFAARALEEMRRWKEPAAAARHGVIATAPVITACGLIMAATLATLATTGLELTEQLGFAFACGLLLHTFVVCPLLIPCAFVLLQRRRDRAVKDPGRRSPVPASVS